MIGIFLQNFEINEMELFDTLGFNEYTHVNCKNKIKKT